MFLAVIAVFAIGVTTGVSLDQNVPAVTKFGDKYLSAPGYTKEEVNGYDVVIVDEEKETE